MGWTRPSGHIIRDFAAVLLFVGPNVFGETAASWAFFFYSFAPLGIMAGRCFMPDMPSLALSIIGLYFFQRWTESESGARMRSTSFAASAVCISLSILIKLPSAIIGAPLACLALAAGFGRRFPGEFRAHRAPLQLLGFWGVAPFSAAPLDRY